MARDACRDAVRGLTSLEMTIVNTSNLKWTRHSGYIGQITYADTIFPCFAFLSGMSPTPARRNVGLIGVGLGLNTLSALASGRDAVRIPGVLQRLGLASIIANEPLFSPLRHYHGAPLVALWYAVSLLGCAHTGPETNPLAHPAYHGADPLATAQTRIDTFLFGPRLHSATFDPEGLLGSLTTALSMLIGRAFVESDAAVPQKAMAAVGMMAAGEALHYLLPKYAPISKNLWTPSFVLVTSGISILKYLAVETLYPYLPQLMQDVLLAVGKRSFESYTISTMLTILLRMGGPRSIMAACVRLAEPVMSPAAADFVMSSALTAVVAAASQLLVSRNLRVRW